MYMRLKTKRLIADMLLFTLLLTGCSSGNGNTPASVTPTPGRSVSQDDASGNTPAPTLKPAATNTPKPTATPAPEQTYKVGCELVYDALSVPADRKFTTYVFSITGEPADLTDKPKGLFYGMNYNLKGRDSERPVYVEVWDKDGNKILSQSAGLRIYGAYSRQNYLKSVKLFARESYDPENKNFKYNLFDTQKLYEDKPVKKYKRLVLRDSGNDYQFAWIRDELAQTLADKAGFTDCEAVAPAIYYLNGEYRGFYWLHEVYSDSYFKNKYGDEGKNGEFVVIEGNERNKSTGDDDEENVKASKEYNASYAELSNLDYTDDANYAKLNAFMDVENYIKYYAYNIYICNKDWPNNNYKCYRYYAPDGEKYEDGTIYDGRWRFLLHDMDYSMGLYSQTECMANYDKLGEVLSEKIQNDKKVMVKNDKYSPLFAALMKREECRELFTSFTLELADGALSADSICGTLDSMNKERETEMKYFFEYIDELRKLEEEWKAKKGGKNTNIWTNGYLYYGYTEDIKKFAKQRKNFSQEYIERNFNITTDR